MVELWCSSVARHDHESGDGTRARRESPDESCFTKRHDTDFTWVMSQTHMRCVFVSCRCIVYAGCGGMHRLSLCECARKSKRNAAHRARVARVCEIKYATPCTRCAYDVLRRESCVLSPLCTILHEDGLRHCCAREQVPCAVEHRVAHNTSRTLQLRRRDE